MIDLSRTPWRWIVLSERHGIACLVDAEHHDWLTQWGWNYGWHVKTKWKFYAKRNVGASRSTVYMHRELLARVEPRPLHEMMVLHGDHINGQSLDNRCANLRWATPAENNANARPRGSIPSIEAIAAKLAASVTPAEAVPF